MKKKTIEMKELLDIMKHMNKHYAMTLKQLNLFWFILTLVTNTIWLGFFAMSR